jgi:hypothetical protein
VTSRTPRSGGDLSRIGPGLLLLLCACDRGVDARGPDQPVPSAAASPARASAASPKAPAAAALPPSDGHVDAPGAGREVAIPAGALRLGSLTGSPGRDPSREADLVEIALGAYAIDALPYPNDPGAAPRASTDRDEAHALCRREGKRLCSEFEWERACKGDVDRAYPAEPYDPARCAREPLSCASPFGVFALGTLGREWTSSRAGSSFGDPARSAVVRGAAAQAPAAAHRCAARDATTPDSKSEGLLFRCCRGPEADLAYPEESPSAPFVEQSWDAAQIRTLLAQMPETAALADVFRAFPAAPDGPRAPRAGRKPASIAPWSPAHGALRWTPVRGEQLGVIAGDTPAGATLIAYYQPSGGRPLFGASYLTRDEHEPILVAYRADAPREVLFSTCWGCGGEGGSVELGPDARVRIVPR